MYWDINIVIFSDCGTDSTTATDIAHDSNIHLHVKENVNYLHDYFVHKRSIIVVSRNQTYYPIYMLYTSIYFKSGIVDKRVYEHGDRAVVIISQIVQDYLNKTLKSHKCIDLHMIKYFVRHTNNVEINHLYIGDTNMCYGVCLNVMITDGGLNKDKPTKVYIPIQHSMYRHSHELTFDIMGPEQSNDWGILKTVIGMINQSIAEYSASKGRIISDDKSQPLMQRVDPIYPFITHSKWAKYGGHVFGMLSQFLLFYVDPNTIIDADVKNVVSYIVEPHVINNVIKSYSPPIPDRRHQELNSAIYNQYLYQLLFLTFIDVLHTHRNDPIRKDIKKIMKNIKGRGGVIINKFSSNIIVRLRDVLKEYPRDLHNIIKMMMHDDPEHTLDNSFLEFDKYIVTRLVAMSAQRCKDTIQNMLSKHIVIGEPSYAVNMPNMLSSCVSAISSTGANTTLPYCKDKRLIISQDRFDEYLDILVMDIQNPLKAKYLTLYTFIPRSIDYFDFIIRPNEKIYVTL